MLQTYVSSVSVVSDICSNCFNADVVCFNCFHADVVKVDRDITMVVHVCCKHLSQCFICVLYTYVASVLDACLKCFICVLFYIASVASECFKSRSRYCTCCNDVSTICPKYFICFRRMSQKFYLDVTKVDLVFECCSWMLQK
jgi:hypothetical protein